MELCSLFLCVIFFTLASSTELSKYTFPENFQFGVTSSSYQIEGGVFEDGKGKSIWDHLLHKYPDLVADKSNGDVACDSYHKWQEDIELIKHLGAKFYRFSVSWPRIIPSGHKGSKVNEKGVAYYNKLIDGLLAVGITPMVSLYHWDLPHALQKKGGWMERSIIEDFVYYANTLFKAYGDRVKYWVTFNEPFQICEYGYSGTELAPFLNLTGIGGYQCTHNLLLSHGHTFREYQEKYKATQKGQIGITVNSGWFEPKEDTDEDRKAAEQVLQFSYGWFMNPVVKGNYPPIMIERIDAISREQGYEVSRLPKFSKKERKMMRKSFDFVGLNHYSSALASFSDSFYQPSFGYDCGVAAFPNEEWESSTTLPGLLMAPFGFRKLLAWIKNEYNNPPVYITENGWATDAGFNDDKRIQYIESYLSELLKAIHDDGCNVVGYAYWSFLDNFEWLHGYKTKFGLIEVDFNSPNRTRTPKKSYGVFQKIISSRKLF